MLNVLRLACAFRHRCITRKQLYSCDRELVRAMTLVTLAHVQSMKRFISRPAPMHAVIIKVRTAGKPSKSWRSVDSSIQRRRTNFLRVDCTQSKGLRFQIEDANDAFGTRLSVLRECMRTPAFQPMEKQIFRCQSCRVKLNIGGLDSLAGPDNSHGSSGYKQVPNTASSSFGGSKVDESFIVLDHNKSKGASGHLLCLLTCRALACDDTFRAGLSWMHVLCC